MQLSAVLLARAIAFIETFDLNPKARVFLPDVVKAIVERYKFQKFPLEFKDFNEQSGVEFFMGKIGDEVIEKLVIYNSGILVETRSNTKTSQALIEDALTWAKSTFGLNYQSGMVKRFLYVSQLTFHSEVSLNAISPALQKLADRVGSEVSGILGEKLEYQTASLAIHHDPLKRKNPIAGFTIQPRVDAPFTENKYFSEAPVPTDVHFALLKEFEADILRESKPA
ncbi:MAG: hypothetical protein ACLP56_02285 [Candidatus Sulfotelmatobacter sp.]